jgi:hypothetical protein
LIFCAIKHPLREQDHPGAGTVGRQATLQGSDQRLPQLEDPRQLVDGGGLPTGQHDPIQPGELGRAAYGSNVRTARRQHAEMLAYITLQSEDTDDRCAAHQPR